MALSNSEIKIGYDQGYYEGHRAAEKEDRNANMP